MIHQSNYINTWCLLEKWIFCEFLIHLISGSLLFIDFHMRWLLLYVCVSTYMEELILKCGVVDLIIEIDELSMRLDFCSWDVLLLYCRILYNSGRKWEICKCVWFNPPLAHLYEVIWWETTEGTLDTLPIFSIHYYTKSG